MLLAMLETDQSIRWVMPFGNYFSDHELASA
jgi:hypothetical protein